MLMQIILVLLLTISSFVLAEESQEIRVQLTTSSPLQPIYLSKIQGQGQDSTYLAQLENVLAYDFNYSGTTKVAARNQEKEQMLSSSWKIGCEGLDVVNCTRISLLSSARTKEEIVNSKTKMIRISLPVAKSQDRGTFFFLGVVAFEARKTRLGSLLSKYFLFFSLSAF